eukprot:6581656-Prymnesium_polylepis.1
MATDPRPHPQTPHPARGGARRGVGAGGWSAGWAASQLVGDHLFVDEALPLVLVAVEVEHLEAARRMRGLGVRAR